MREHVKYWRDYFSHLVGETHVSMNDVNLTGSRECYVSYCLIFWGKNLFMTALKNVSSSGFLA